MRPRKGSTILVVEDNEEDEALALRGFRQHLPNAKVDVARNGQEAIDALLGKPDGSGNRIHALPDLVLLDLKLPVVSGFDVLRVIREDAATRLVPVVVFTSSDELKEVHRSYELGANTFIQKPMDFDEYLRTIGELTHYWFDRATLPGA